MKLKDVKMGSVLFYRQYSAHEQNRTSRQSQGIARIARSDNLALGLVGRDLRAVDLKRDEKASQRLRGQGRRRGRREGEEGPGKAAGSPDEPGVAPRTTLVVQVA